MIKDYGFNLVNLWRYWADFSTMFFFAANVDGTPFQYVGVGYNLFSGNPELSIDPGLLLDRRILQVTIESKWFQNRHLIACFSRLTKL